MVSLARKTLLREWPRYLPAILAICFAGVLLFMQAALVLGIFGNAAVYVTKSSPDLWVGFPGTQSVSQGRAINADLETLLRMNDNIAAVEPFQWVDADWRSPQTKGGVSVYVIGINPNQNGMIFDQALDANLRPWLLEPGAVIVDRADLASLGVETGSWATIDGKSVHVVATTSGLRALGGVNVISSLDTARQLTASRDKDRVTYLVAKLHDPQNANAVRKQLLGKTAFGVYDVWTAGEFAQRSQFSFLLDTGAGVAVLFMAVIVMLVGLVVASQALIAVVISSAREYATLNALGAGMAALRRVVLEQAAWIGGIGLLFSAGVSFLLKLLATSRDVLVETPLVMVLLWAGVVLGIALLSGLFAMRGLLRADPALLLR
jgi:putative ABC transport system permease protein